MCKKSINFTFIFILTAPYSYRSKGIRLFKANKYDFFLFFFFFSTLKYCNNFFFSKMVINLENFFPYYAKMWFAINSVVLNEWNLRSRGECFVNAEWDLTVTIVQTHDFFRTEKREAFFEIDVRTQQGKRDLWVRIWPLGSRFIYIFMCKVFSTLTPHI